MLNVLVPRERRPGETRVAATPETVKRMVKEGLAVTVEAGAGAGAHLRDAQFEEAGARIGTGQPQALFAQADVVLKVAPPGPGDTSGEEESSWFKEGACLISFLAPHRHPEMVRRLLARRVSALAMELVPRTTRAQKMDALSSQANIAGYKAVLLAAARLDKYLPLLMTAAGTVQPARFVVLGAGVAGLQALATARRLGAVVEVSDIRPAVKEQIESLGGRFIEPPRLEGGENQGGYAREVSADFLHQQRELVKARIAVADVVITTAQVPGRPAPRLVTADMVESMRPGAVIVDLAAEQGGNCELTVPGREVEHRGVHILGQTNLPATLPVDASHLYARNVLEVVLLVTKKGEPHLDLADDIVSAMLLSHAGEVRHGPTAELLRSQEVAAS